ncbi:hypothetical protein ACLOJK_012910 [Asimina triloba]
MMMIYEAPTNERRGFYAIEEKKLVVDVRLHHRLLFQIIHSLELGAMFSKLFLLFFLAHLTISTAQIADFSFHGLLNLGAVSTSTPQSSGLFKLTNGTDFPAARAFYPLPLAFKNTTTGDVSSFSTCFVFAISPDAPTGSGPHGMSFVISPRDRLAGLPSQHLGLFNSTHVDNDTANYVFAVELDTLQSKEAGEKIDSNSSGIHVKSTSAGYYSDRDGEFNKLRLGSGRPIQIWLEYDGQGKQLNLTLHPTDIPRPSRSLLALDLDLSPIILNSMYVGFSSSATAMASSHYVLGWSFKMNGEAQAIDISKLPPLPWRTAEGNSKDSKVLIIGLPAIGVTFVLVSILIIAAIVRRKKKSPQLVVEDWEPEYGPRRFSYKDLKAATRGFSAKDLLGAGGFGNVYRGILPKSKTEVAVKRVSHGSRQGMKEFVAEIESLGRLRHRNLVQLLGYCRRKGELLLVYELMPNGSLDHFLFGEPAISLGWSQRYPIIKGVACGLLYLHEQWEKVIIHRDIKASNVLLDREMNGRLGDFGLARSYGHGSTPQITHVAGTFGYLAPEINTTGKATKSTDVFAFGVFMLEVTCGRKPIERHASPEECILVDWVLECWRRGSILDAADPKMGSDGVELEMELVMKLGLLCSHQHAAARPSMRQVLQYLEFDAPMPGLSPDDFILSHLIAEDGNTPKEDHSILNLSSVQASVLSGGR